MNRGYTIFVAVPVVGAAVVALATLNDGLYRLLVKEDAILEWTQVAMYATVVAIAAATLRGHARRRDTGATLVAGGLAVVSLLAIGEELSWGQRIIGFDTPEIASGNRQGELTLHNDGRVEDLARLALLVAALVGAVAPVAVRRRTPFVPPVTVVACCSVAFVYLAYRLVWLPHPSYTQAKYSEWPETCFALALALWCADVGSRVYPSLGRLSGTGRSP